MRGFSSRTSSWQSFSVAGGLVKVMLQDELRRYRIDGFVFHAAQAALRFHRGKALVDARHRQAEAAFQPPREFLDALRQRVLAALAHRQADDELRGTPFLHQGMNLLEL